MGRYVVYDLLLRSVQVTTGIVYGLRAVPIVYGLCASRCMVSVLFVTCVQDFCASSNNNNR